MRLLRRRMARQSVLMAQLNPPENRGGVQLARTFIRNFADGDDRALGLMHIQNSGGIAAIGHDRQMTQTGYNLTQ